MAITKVTSGMRTLGTGEVTSTNILDGTIENVDISATAAIASTKLSGVDSGLASVQTFTSSGTWTRPTGITKVIIEVQGAGGGGSSENAGHYWAHTGAGGGYAKKFLDVSSISSSTITVGSGGAGVANGGTPNAGGASSWSDGTNTITGNGGVGGSPNRSDTAFRGAAGGTATGGDINIQGGPRSSEYRDVGSFGASYLGIAGYGVTVNGYDSSADLKNATGYGAGGGGTETSGLNSGSGSDGIVIVWEYK